MTAEQEEAAQMRTGYAVSQVVNISTTRGSFLLTSDRSATLIDVLNAHQMIA